MTLCQEMETPTTTRNTKSLILITAIVVAVIGSLLMSPTSDMFTALIRIVISTLAALLLVVALMVIRRRAVHLSFGIAIGSGAAVGIVAALICELGLCIVSALTT